MFTSAVQRLAGVTQVASALEGFAFHNRLTHTLEMAQIGRRLTEKLLEENPVDLIEEIGGLNPDIVEAACLAHDTGHPPFGHTGEDALREVLEGHGVSEGFEGNAQSLRVVTTLEPYRPTFLGLNLTRATINAMMKYPRFKSETTEGSPKWGIYETERTVWKWAKEALPENRVRSSEADIMDIADDIAYSVHDLHDFFKCHFIPLDRLVNSDSEFDGFFTRAFYGWRDVPELFSGEDRDSIQTSFRRFLKEHAPLTASYSGSHSDRARLRLITSNLIKRFRDAISITQTGAVPLIDVTPEAKREILLLRQLTAVYVHRNSMLLAQREGHKLVIRALFKAFAEAVETDNYDLFPPQYRDVMMAPERLREFCGGTQREHCLRLTADMICSLTDNQALAIYRRLTGFGPGQLVDGAVI